MGEKRGFFRHLRNEQVKHNGDINAKYVNQSKADWGRRGTKTPNAQKEKRGALEAWRDPKMKIENFKQTPKFKSKRNGKQPESGGATAPHKRGALAGR